MNSTHMKLYGKNQVVLTIPPTAEATAKRAERAATYNEYIKLVN